MKNAKQKATPKPRVEHISIKTIRFTRCYLVISDVFFWVNEMQAAAKKNALMA